MPTTHNPTVDQLVQLVHPHTGLNISDDERNIILNAITEIDRLQTLAITLSEEKNFWEKEARNVG
jgi:hypothetical protein